MPAPTPDTVLDLETLSKEGTPPASRLSNARHAEDIYWVLKDAALPRMQRAAIIQGMFDGNAPFKNAKLRQRGEAWRANFNTLEGASRKDSSKTPFYDLLTSGPFYAECETNVSTETVPAPEASRVRTEQFQTLLSSYNSFHMAWWEMLDGYIGFNKGFLWWPRSDSWHFKCLPWHRVYFPDATGINPEEWELFVVEHHWPVHQLWSFVKDEQAAKAAGYNKEQVIKAIRGAVPRSLGDMQDPMQLQQALKNQELYLSTASQTVQAASIYVREFNGKWSHMMVTTASRSSDSSRSSARPMSPIEAQQFQQGEAGTESRSKLQPKDWLYFKKEVADNVWQIFCPFVFEPEDGAINTLGGLGKRTISIMQLKDRMRCAQADNVLMSTQILLQATTGGAHAKQGIIQMGGGVVTLPPGYAVQQASIIGDVERTLAVNNDLDRMLDTNTGTYRPQFEKPSGNPETATAAQQRFAQSTVLTTSAVLRFYVQADHFYDECYRRATMTVSSSSNDPAHVAAREFQKACKDAGLSEKQITDRKPGFVKAMRTIGNGSPVMRQQVAAALAQIVPFLGPRGLDQWKEMFVSAWAGQQGVSRLLPKEDRQQIPTEAARIAHSENNDMRDGAPPFFMESDEHETHAQVHLAAAVAAIRSVSEQGADPAIPFTFLQLAMPHTTQHISKIPRKQVREQMEDAYRQVAQGASQVEQAAMQQMKQAQQATEQQAEGQGELQIKMAELQLKVKELEMKMQLEQQKAQQDMALAEKKLEHEIALDERRFEHESAQAKQELQFDQQKQSQELQMQKQKQVAEGQMMKQKLSMQQEAAKQKKEDSK